MKRILLFDDEKKYNELIARYLEGEEILQSLVDSFNQCGEGYKVKIEDIPEMLSNPKSFYYEKVILPKGIPAIGGTVMTESAHMASIYLPDEYNVFTGTVKIVKSDMAYKFERSNSFTASEKAAIQIEWYNLENGKITLRKEVKENVRESVKIYTQSEKGNETLRQLQNMCDCLNYFAENLPSNSNPATITSSWLQRSAKDSKREGEMNLPYSEYIWKIKPDLISQI